jgi:2-polyprenyl-3-methyl-5-hydroxy-6-metoxy-1,4-benzoquinol methylase
MEQIIHYTYCPVCGSDAIQDVLEVKDFTVSHKTFPVMECTACTLRFTQDVPDAASISPYYKSEEYISHTDTSKGLINRLYQSVRKRTLKQKRKLIEKTTGIKKGALLDVGSGTGAFVQHMQQHGWNVTGLEPDGDARKVAKESNGVELTDISRFYQLPAGSFDAITLWHVLEHVHELHAYVQQLTKLLKPNGRLFIALPNYTAKDAAVYKGYWAAYDVPRHLYHFSPAAVKVLMEKNGLQLQNHIPMWFDSFYISMLSSKYKNGKTNLVAAFINGFLSNLKAMRDVKKCSSVIYVVQAAG